VDGRGAAPEPAGSDGHHGVGRSAGR
jgi:hypothetical protein